MGKTWKDERGAKMSKVKAKKTTQKTRDAKKPSPPTQQPTPTLIFTAPQRTQDAATEMAKTADGFINFAAKLGVAGGGLQGNNMLGEGFYSFNLITRNRVQLEAAYRGSWISRKMIDIPAEDMTRAGIEITTNEAPDQLKKLTAAMSHLKIWACLANGIRWGGLYGGAISVLQIKGQKLDTPLDPDTIAKDMFQGISTYDRWQLNPDLTEVIDSGPDQGLPKYYYIISSSTSTAEAFDPASDGGQIKVHHSRCIRHGGAPLPFFQAITEMMWDESVLEVLWDRLIAFDTATLSTANLINRAQLRTIGVDGLREILAAGGDAEQALLSQFEMMRMFQSNEGLTLMDKEDVFASTAYTFSGLADVLLQMAQQLSGATDIPLIRLFSQSPTGMSATGDSDIRLYYDGINARQESKLRNGVWMVIKVLWRSLFEEAVPQDLEFTFAPLWQMTPTDKAVNAKSNAETITGAFDAGLIKKSTAVKELRQTSGDSGLFSNIDDEEIAEAEEDDENPPELPSMNPSSEKPEEKSEPIPQVKDSAAKKIAKFLRGK